MFLEGDAGIGKSRLLRNLQRDAAESGFEVLPGRCLEHFDLPYLPFRSSFLPCLAAVARSTSGLEPSGDLLDRVLEAPDGDVLMDGTSFTPEHSRLLHAVATVAMAAARNRPLLVTVDDLHWADTLSLDLLVQLVFETGDAAISGPVPLCVVATHRPGPGGRLARDLDRMLREEICHRVEVGPLAEVDAAQLVRDLGLARASRQLVNAILRASGGNPLMLESAVPQMLHGRVRDEGGELVPIGSLEDLAVPAELSAAVSERLATLDPDLRGLLAVAAVVGDEFVEGDLAAVSGIGEATVSEHLAGAIADGLLLRDHDRLTFTNPTFARVLRAATPPRRRDEIHLAAADALRHSAVPHDVTLTVGWHLAAAGDAADPAAALAGCRAAAERAWQLAAWAEAARYYDAATAAARRGDEPTLVVADLLARAGAAHSRNLDPGPGRARLREAIDRFEAAGDRLGTVRSWIELLHAQVAWSTFGQPIDMAPLTDLLPAIEADDVVLCARGYAQLAEAAWPQGRVSLTERHAARALELAERADDANARTRAYLARAQARWLRLDLEGALEALVAADESARGSGDLWLEGIALPRLALTLLWLGRIDEAHTHARAALANSEEIANFSEQSLALAALTGVAVARGRFEEAEERAEAALGAIRISRYTWSASLVFPALVTARLAQGDVLGARSAIDQWSATVDSLDDAAYGNTIDLVELLVAFHGDEVDRVRRAFAAAPNLVDGPHAVFIGGVQRVAALVEMADVVSSPEPFAGWRTALDDATDHGMLLTEGLVMLLPRVQADLAARAGRVDDAAAGYRDAIETATRIGSLPEVGRAQLGLARLLRAEAPEAAHAAATAAAACFAELSMPVLELAARELLAAPTQARPPAEADTSTPVRTQPRHDTMVLLFTDVVDSTRLTEELGDEAYLARAEALDEQARASIARCGGQPEDGIRPGDGILAFFGQVTQAIRCAALAHEHAAANQLQLHVGLHVGAVIRSRTGIHGGSVNLAARVCGAAPAGLTLASAALRDAAGAAAPATFDEFGVHRLKGIAEPQHLYVVRHLPTTD